MIIFQLPAQIMLSLLAKAHKKTCFIFLSGSTKGGAGSPSGAARQKGNRQSRATSQPWGAVSIGVTWARWTMVGEQPWEVTPTQGDSSAPTSSRPCSMSGPCQHFIARHGSDGKAAGGVSTD